MRNLYLRKLLVISLFSFMKNEVDGQISLPVVEGFSYAKKDGTPSMPSGFTHSGLGSYDGALKFDNSGDWMILNFTGIPGILVFDLGVNNNFPGNIPSGATFSVEESIDGATWTTLGAYTGVTGGAKTLNPSASSRYIRWIYTIKPTDTNIALKNIQLTDASNPDPYYRSKSSGNWNNHDSWEISSDGITWANAVNSYPTGFTGGITIGNNHVITLTNDASAKLLTIDAGGTLTNTNVTGGYLLTIEDEGTSAPDFVISGTYVLFGKGPVFSWGATALVTNGSLVRADGNGGVGQSDDFAYSNKVTFKTGSVFEWNNANAFETSGITYFPNSLENDIPVFKITDVAASVGSVSVTTFNGVVKVDKDFIFTGVGKKHFRNGVTGSATLTQNKSSGSFNINGINAILGGSSLKIILATPINFNNSVTVPTDSSITISEANVNNSSVGNVFKVDGMLDLTDRQITNTDGTVIVNGTYRTSHSGGFSGGGSSIPSGNNISIILNPGSTIELYASGDQGLNRRDDFANLIFSGSGIKTPGNSFIPNGNITIKEDAILDCTGHNVGGVPTHLTMMDNSRLIVGTVNTQPAMEGVYSITGGVVQFVNSSGTSQSIRSRTYQNIEVTGNNVGNSTGSILLNSGGTFTIKNGGVFSINDNSIRGTDETASVIVEAGGIFKSGNNNGFHGYVPELINNSSIHANITNIILEPGSTVQYTRNKPQHSTDDQPVTNANNLIYQNLILSGSGNKIAPSGILEIKGKLSKEGTAVFVHNNGTVLMNATSQQAYTSTSPQMEFYNFINNNPAGLNVNDSLSVYRLLTLADDSKIILNNHITLRSDKNNTASVGKIVTGTIEYGVGRFIAERYINTNTVNGGHNKSWQFIATPAFGETIFNTWQEKGNTSVQGYGTWITDPLGISNGFDATSVASSMKYYDPVTNDWKGISGTNVDLANPKGYMLFVRGDRQARGLNAPATPTILRTIGKLYSPASGSEPPVSYVSAGQFQSIGNPYTSAIAFSKITASDIENSYIVWDPSLSGNYGLGGYQTISGATSFKAIPGGTSIYDKVSDYRNIQSGQAFFVRNPTETMATVMFTEDCKVSDGHHLVNRGSVPGIPGRRLLFTNLYTAEGIIADGNAVVFDLQFSNKIDRDDALKINNGGENFGLRSNLKILAVEARQPLSFTDTIFYDMRNLQKKNHALVFNPINMEAGLDAFFIDNYLKTEQQINLSDSFKIMFSVNSEPASAAADRFMIVFRAAAGPLAVSFVSVNAVLKDNAVVIYWKVENEKDILEYEVEHSWDGIHFSFLGKIEAKNFMRNPYQYSDNHPGNGYHYYRIKSIEKAGKIEYSIVVKVFLKEEKSVFIVASNSINDNMIQIGFTNQPKGNYQIILANSLGQLMNTRKIDHTGGSNIYHLWFDKYSGKGIYHLTILKPNLEKEILKVMKE